MNSEILPAFMLITVDIWMSNAVESQLPELNGRNNVTRKLMNNAENFEKKKVCKMWRSIFISNLIHF